MERSGAPYTALENNSSRVTHASDPILIFLDQYKVLQKRSVSHNPPHHNTKRLQSIKEIPQNPRFYASPSQRPSCIILTC